MPFDQAKMWQAIEARLAATDNPRHRQMLEVVIEHAKAEADRSVERLMATLVDDPQYHFWVRARDVGPKGRDRVHDYYVAFATSGGAVFESPKDRIVVDDHNVVSEAEVKNYVPGTVAKARGYNVPDESGHYLVRFRTSCSSSSAMTRPARSVRIRIRRWILMRGSVSPRPICQSPTSTTSRSCTQRSGRNRPARSTLPL
jgi:hypothetical protein